MWRNPSNNYEEYFRDHRERDNEQWRNQTPMESFDQPPYFQHQNEDMEYEWNYQHHYEPSNEEMWYMENYQCQQESYNSNPRVTSMLQQFLESLERGMDKMENKIERDFREISDRLDELTLGYDSLQAKVDIQEASNDDDDMVQEILEKFEEAMDKMENKMERAFKEVSERLDGLTCRYYSLQEKVEILEASNDDEDMVQESGAWNVFPKEHDVVDEHQKDCRQQQCLYEDDEESIQFHEDALNEDVQDAQFPLKEEIEETPKDAEMTLEGEVVEIFFPYYETVVEYQDDTINTQQQSPAGEEVEEIIQLHEDALDKDALALIVAVMNKETLRFNNASTNETDKEEEEVFQLYELPQKELHHDEAVEQRVPGTPTPRLKHPQGLRKRLEWRIKHKWKIKLHNV